MRKKDWSCTVKFECQYHKDGCQKCCEIPGLVYLSPDDIKRISKNLNLTEEELLLNVAKVVTKDGQDHYVIEITENKPCPFLDKGCIIWESRPLQCAQFPTGWTHVDVADVCPGIGVGEQVEEKPIEGNPFL